MSRTHHWYLDRARRLAAVPFKDAAEERAFKAYEAWYMSTPEARSMWESATGYNRKGYYKEELRRARENWGLRKIASDEARWSVELWWLDISLHERAMFWDGVPKYLRNNTPRWVGSFDKAKQHSG